MNVSSNPQNQVQNQNIQMYVYILFALNLEVGINIEQLCQFSLDGSFSRNLERFSECQRSRMDSIALLYCLADDVNTCTVDIRTNTDTNNDMRMMSNLTRFRIQISYKFEHERNIERGRK